MEEIIGSAVVPIKRVRRTFSKKFKAHLVELVESGEQSIASIAQSHQINANLLHKWVVLAKQSEDVPTMVPVSVPTPSGSNLTCLELVGHNYTLKFSHDWDPVKVACLIKSLS